MNVFLKTLMNAKVTHVKMVQVALMNCKVTFVIAVVQATKAHIVQ